MHVWITIKFLQMNIDKDIFTADVIVMLHKYEQI